LGARGWRPNWTCWQLQLGSEGEPVWASRLVWELQLPRLPTFPTLRSSWLAPSASEWWNDVGSRPAVPTQAVRHGRAHALLTPRAYLGAMREVVAACQAPSLAAHLGTAPHRRATPLARAHTCSPPLSGPARPHSRQSCPRCAPPLSWLGSGDLHAFACWQRVATRGCQQHCSSRPQAACSACSRLSTGRHSPPNRPCALFRHLRLSELTAGSGSQSTNRS
jgi:hypothetical protein